MALSRLEKIHGIIHTASVASAGVGAGMAQIPGADAPVLMTIQAAMIIAIGHEYDVSLTKTAAADLILTFTATMAGRGVSQWLVGWIPGAGSRERDQRNDGGGLDRSGRVGC